MIKITRTGVGVVSHAGTIRDSFGSGLLPIQAAPDAATTFKVNARVSPDAPWVEIKAAGTAAFLEAISFVPEVQLQITAGSGSVTLWVAEQ